MFISFSMLLSVVTDGCVQRWPYEEGGLRLGVAPR